MKKLFSISALLFALLFCAQAQAAGTRPGNMTASGAIVGTQIVWCPTGITADLQCTFTQIATFMYSLMSGDCTATSGGAVTCAKINGNTFPASGTSGGIPYFSGANAISSSAALTANLPVIGGGAGVAPSVGSRSGNTTQFGTTSGTLTSGNCVKFDASGNLVDNGSTCGAGGGTVGLLPYVSGSYYAPFGGTTAISSQLYANGTTYCRVAYFKNLGTVDLMGANVQIVSSGGNFQLAVYAISASTQLPTGTPLITTASMSTTTNATPTGTVNSGTPFQLGSSSSALTPYGFCIMVDATAGGVAGFPATSNAATGMATDVGSTTAAGAMTGLAGFGSVQLSGQTFGTWPNLTAAGFTRNNFGGIIPVFHLSSVP